MTKPVILVTRPEPHATKLADELTRLGMVPIKSPVLKVSALEPFTGPTGSTRPDILIITSLNALRYLDDAEIEKLANIPLLTSGEATAAEAISRGFRSVSGSRHNGADGVLEQLMERLAQLRPDHKRPEILFLTGRPRTPTLERELPRHGNLNVVEVYETRYATSFSSQALSALQSGTVDAVTAFSERSALGFLKLLNASFDPDKIASLRQTNVFALSQKIADEFLRAGFENTHTSDHPNQQSLVTKLVDQLKNH